MTCDAEPGCGLHDDDDYCDVVITEPVPIRYGFGTPRAAGLGDRGYVHGSDILLTLKDTEYGAPWTSEKLAKFGEALLAGWDAVHELRQQKATIDQIVTVRQITELLTAGHSMIDVPMLLGVEWNDVLMSLRPHNKPFWAAWDDLEWLYWESLIAGDGPFHAASLGRALGWKRPTSSVRLATEGLLTVYGKEYVRHKGGRATSPATQMIEHLMGYGYSNAEIHAKLREAGHNLSSSDVSTRRSQIKRRLGASLIAS